MNNHQILIIGGGSGGISVAARLALAQPDLDVAILEPSDKHYYQPIWTLVGGGVFEKEISERNEADFIPAGVTWIRERAAEIDPESRTVTAESGSKFGYEQLVVAAGIQLDWDKIEGLAGHLGKDGICSNYLYETVDSTWHALQGLEEGNAVFSFPNTPIKCAGAPQKIMYLAEHHLRRRGVRDKCRVIYAAASPGIFGVERYAKSLRHVVESRGIETFFQHDLTAVRPASKEAVFHNLASGEEMVLEYEMLHVAPPQSSPDFLEKSPLANEAGWVDVGKHDLQHVRYPDVFALGDCASTPNAKTGAAIRKQAPVLVENLLAHRAGKDLTGSYDGYGSCPLVTGYGTLILAEFGYDGAILESFPFDQSKERYSMYALKAYALPEMYWNGMLRGRM